MTCHTDEGSSINDVTALGGGGQGFCYDRTKALFLKKRFDGGRGDTNCPKLRDFIYEPPLMSILTDKEIY